MALQFYEKVEILVCRQNPDLIGMFGYILGKSYSEEPSGSSPEPEEVVAYGIFFEEIEKVFSFDLDEIRGTGEIADRSRFYPD